MSVWATSLLGVAIKQEIWGFYLFIYLFFPLVMFPYEIPKLPTNLPVRGLPGVWKLLLFYDSLPGQISVPNSFVSLLSAIYFFFYFLLKTMGCLSGCLICSASVQKLFCGICSAFKCSFIEFVGGKVVSPSYSSALLASPPQPPPATSFGLLNSCSA